MKKLLLLIPAVALLIGGCGKFGEKKRIQDSIREADSIAAYEAAVAAAEAARADSIRRDSIAAVQSALENIPTFNQVMDAYDRKSLFKSKGFATSTKEVYNEMYDMYEPMLTATYNPAPGISYKYKEDWGGFKITITGAPDFLDQYYAAAKAWMEKYKRDAGSDDWWAQASSATKSGNTITLYFAGD